ncbi:MAG: MliC family protein [Leptotrichiaceae bacterium]|nr:MliC family protein [Leptotrichiaceae bacterium]
MKKFRNLILITAGMTILSCSSMENGGISIGGNTSGMKMKNVDYYSCPVDDVKIEYMDKGEKIKLTDFSGDIYELKISKAASGSYYESSAGSFHVKGDEAVLVLNGRTFTCGKRQAVK